jgi:hypothetical protein
MNSLRDLTPCPPRSAIAPEFPKSNPSRHRLVATYSGTMPDRAATVEVDGFSSYPSPSLQHDQSDSLLRRACARIR